MLLADRVRRLTLGILRLVHSKTPFIAAFFVVQNFRRLVLKTLIRLYFYSKQELVNHSAHGFGEPIRLLNNAGDVLLSFFERGF